MDKYLIFKNIPEMTTFLFSYMYFVLSLCLFANHSYNDH